MLTRRFLLSAALCAPALSVSRALGGDMPEGLLFSNAALRGGFDTSGQIVMPEASGGDSRRFARVLKEAASRGRPVFLPPGTYRISNIDLPDNTEINGVPGASRIEYTGDGHLFAATNLKRIRLSGLVIDGANRWLGDYAGGLVHCIGVGRVEIHDCEITGSGRNALHLEGSGGDISENRISGAQDAGIYAVESRDLSIRDNRVSGCGNGGILVHRYSPGNDGTLVTGNRVSGILARSGGTGQNGNGINIFRAKNVMVANNHIEDCAFSAIRANSASGVQISSNQCHNSGETAIYAEFSFEGAIVSANIIDGAANGISIANFNEGGRLASVSGNMLRNIIHTGPYAPTDGGFGIGISVEADTVVSGNVLDTVSKWGMLLGWGPYLRNVVATSNMVRQCPVGCAVSIVDGAGSALIAENSFSAVSEASVAGYHWNDRMTGDLARGEASGFGHLTIERNRVS